MRKIFQIVAVLAITSMSAMVSCKGSSDDPKPDPAGPTITITAPAENTEFTTGSPVAITAAVTSGSALSTLTATVTFLHDPLILAPSKLKSLPVAWAPAAKVITLNGTGSQSLASQVLYTAIDANAKAGVYNLSLEVKDSAGKTAKKDIAFAIIN